MPNTPLTERQEALLNHLESVYLLAQSVAPDAEAAARLVEATYTQAFVTLPLLGSQDRDEKRWLFRLVMQIRREQAEFERQEATPPAMPSAALHDLRSRLARQVADRALPTVLATLSDEQRLILLLCDAEGLTCADAGFVLGLEAETACHLLDEARAATHEAMRAEASASERALLDENLPDGWLRPTLRRMVEAEFDLPPATLREAILTAMEQAPQEPATPAATPPPLPASATAAEAARRREAAPPKPQARHRLRRVASVLLLIITVGAIGYVASQSVKPAEPETNLIALAVSQADAVQSSFVTNSPAKAEEYVWDKLRWRLTLPSIDQATLQGAALGEVAPDITVPVFLYDDTAAEAETARITLYVFSYALLDRYTERLQLEPEILRQIQDDRRFDLHDLGERNVLVWRNRDDIYVAVTPGDPEALRRRIVFPS